MSTDAAAARRAADASHRAVAGGHNRLDQDVWWTGRDGITRLVDDLSDDHRRFIARMLIDSAAAHYARVRRNQLFWINADAWLHADGAPNLSPADIEARIRREQERGLHLSEVRDSLLFRRMIRDLDWTHAGVASDEMGCA